jgi:DNA polymerase-1
VTVRDYGLTTNIKKQHLPPQKVYCVSVPSTFIIVRRNGKVSITGNCQNIPIRTKIGKRVRGAFVASPGKLLVSNDLAQIEMVWAAHRSQDPVMMDIFRHKQDLHTRTACGVYNLDYDHCMLLMSKVEGKTATPDEAAEYAYFKQFQRLPCKTVGFGIIYGQTPEGLSESLAGEGVFWSPGDCEKFINKDFFGVYKLLQSMLERDYAFVRRYAMICDDFGRPRLVPEAKSALKKLANEGIRKAGNHPEQASAQGTIKVGMAAVTPIYRKLNTQGINVWPLLQIHDDLMHEVDRDFAEEYGAMVQYEMEEATPLSIPVRSSCNIAERWMDL